MEKQKTRQQIQVEADLKHMEAELWLARIAGGTVSSASFKWALDLKERNKDVTLTGPIIRVCEAWREALARHNAQPRRFVTYNLETGDPENEVE